MSADLKLKHWISRSRSGTLSASTGGTCEVWESFQKKLTLFSHHDERQSWPGHQAVYPPPKPDGLVENLQHHFADASTVQHLPEQPPSRCSNSIQLVQPLYGEPVFFQQHPKFGPAEAPLISQLCIQAAEKRGALWRQNDNGSSWF